MSLFATVFQSVPKTNAVTLQAEELTEFRNYYDLIAHSGPSSILGLSVPMYVYSCRCILSSGFDDKRQLIEMVLHSSLLSRRYSTVRINVSSGRRVAYRCARKDTRKRGQIKQRNWTYTGTANANIDEI